MSMPHLVVRLVFVLTYDKCEELILAFGARHDGTQVLIVMSLVFCH